MPPTILPSHLRHLDALTSRTRNSLTQLVGRQGLEAGTPGPEGPPGGKGEPGKVEVGVPSAATMREAGKPYEPSATEPTTVYLTIDAKAEKVGYEIKVDGKPIFTLPAEISVVPRFETFNVKIKGKWEVVMTEGTLTSLESVYQDL